MLRLTSLPAYRFASLPGFHAEQGSYVHALITTDESFCEPIQPAIVSAKPVAPKSMVYQKPDNTEAIKQQSIKVFPNPSNGVFSIELTNFQNSVHVSVSNLLGEIVYLIHLINTSHYVIDISGRPGGIYFVRLCDREKVISKRIIVK